MAPVVWTFDQMVQARYIRVWPHDGHHSDNNRRHVFLWVELLGCKPGTGRLGGWRDGSGQCDVRRP